MNTRLFLPVLLAAAVASAQPATPDAVPAQPENPPAAPAAPQTEMQKWIEATDAQWQVAFKRDVTDVHEAEVNKVKLQYLSALEDGIKKASSAGDLKGAVALRDEQKRFGDTQLFPEKDEETDAPAVKAIRAAIRAQLAKVEQNHAARAKALHGKYDQFLAQSLAQLTKAQRLDDALLVQAKRDEVAAAWLAGLAATPPAAPVSPVAPEVKAPRAPASPEIAPKEAAGNLIVNGTFEKGTEGWVLQSNKHSGSMEVDQSERHNGKPSLRVTNPNNPIGDDTAVTQTIQVKPNTRYQMSGYIKTKDVEAIKSGGKNGACLSIMGGYTKTPDVTKTKSWTRVVGDFTTGKETETKFGLRLGFYSGLTTGTAWFADVRITELGRNAKK